MTPTKTAEESTGRFAYEGLERIFHEKARLGIMTSLVTTLAASSSPTSRSCATSPTATSAAPPGAQRGRLRRDLEGFHKNRPQTLCRITDEGRRRFLEYINVLETVVQDALKAAPVAAAGTNLTEGWSPV